MAATALQSAHQQPRAQDLSVRGPERRVDTVGIPAPPHPESRRAETAGPDPTGDGRCAAEAATPAEKAPELPRQPGRQAPAVEARAAMGNDATSERAASAEAAPRRAMRVSSAESAKAHQGTLSAFQAGDTARKSAERGGSGSRGWLSSIVIVLILIGLFLALHGPIAHIWPASLRLYQAIGLA